MGFQDWTVRILGTLDPSGISTAIYGVLATILMIIAVRTFRVVEEDIAAPRPYWRLTGRPTAGYWLAALNVLGAIAEVTNAVVHPPASQQTALEQVQQLPVFVVLHVVISLGWALLYFRSSLRLSRMDGPARDFPQDPVTR
ncbi:MAG: hypothetical protein JWP75_3317 [Frondihabitans sp.]|nr:hypothetical protein [Frondihabitans sp.]